MLKQFTTGFALTLGAVAFSQVGIQTENPQATLDVVGNPTNASVLDGIIAPRIEGAQLRAKTYTTAQQGALVYVTLADTSPAGQTEEVTAPGYYYFNGTKWIPAGAGEMVNIYNADGALTDERTLDLNQESLTFTGEQQSTNFSEDGLTQTGITGRSVIKLEAADANANGETTRFAIQANEDDYVSLYANGEINGLTIETSETIDPAFIEFRTSTGAGVGSSQRILITGEGNTGLNTNYPTEKLDIKGITRLRELPLNGAVNAHHTISDDGASATQNQTFTATRTIVADENGVLGYVAGLPAGPVNIYNANGTLDANRTVTTNNNTLTFTGNGNNVRINNTGTESRLTATGTGRGSLSVTGGNSILDIYADNNNVGQIASRGTGSTGLMLRTENAAPISFQTTNTERMRITPTGNVGIGTITPTEKLHVNGITRLQGLPLNGAANAHNTLADGSAAPSQNQTFTATRTVVVDANGVLGYVDGVPSVSNSGSGNWQISETRSSRVVVPASIFTVNSGSRPIMTGRTGTGTTARRSAYEVLNQQGDTQQMAKFLVINGLRLDFMRTTNNNTNVSPKLFNTTGATTVYHLATISTNEPNMDYGMNMNVNPNHYSYNVDGDDEMSCRFDTGRIEYINVMLTFPDGQWYNCTFHATRDANNYYFYTTAQRLN